MGNMGNMGKREREGRNIIVSARCFGRNRKRVFLLWMVMALLFAGCVKKPATTTTQANTQLMEIKANAPTYERQTERYLLKEGANPYKVSYCENGFFYYLMETNDSGANAYELYYQAFDEGEPVRYGWVRDEYIFDFVAKPAEDGVGLCVLCGAEQLVIREFEGDGKQERKIVISALDADLYSHPKLLCRDGGYIVGMYDKAYFLDEEGNVTQTVQLLDEVSSLMATGAGEFYAVTEGIQYIQREGKRVKENPHLEMLPKGADQQKTEREIASEVIRVLPFEDSLVFLYSNCMIYFEPSEPQNQALVDFDRQGIVASQIQAVYGDRNCIRLISMDMSAQNLQVLVINLTPTGVSGTQESSDKTKDGQEKYAADGRRIVRVAIPDSCGFQVEFHARRYSQESDVSVVQVERFKGTLEDYLGKGNRPDVIMFTDHTELDAYVQKGVLVDMLPMFEAWDSSELEGMIPKARELLGNGSEEVMYAMANRFQLLLRTSNGEELDANGKCNAVNYLKWYGDFMTDMEYGGMGTLENVLYAYVPHYYDEDPPAKAYFTSPGFMDLMKTYKTLLEEHGGPVSISYGSNSQKEIAKGPRWQSTYRRYELTEPGISMEGLPWADGSSRVYIRLCDPLAILSTSECPQDAFNFIAYYTSLRLPLMKGEPEGDYGKGGNTEALFSVWGKYLREEIYESERSYGYYEDHTEAFFTEEQSEHLKQLIRDAVPETTTQRDLYAMLLEEMDAYWKGGKSLESACEALQSRAELYLKEK